MRQGETKRLKPKDKHLSVSWKKRDEGRKGKQEAYIPEAELVMVLDVPEDIDQRALVNSLWAAMSGDGVSE